MNLVKIDTICTLIVCNVVHIKFNSIALTNDQFWLWVKEIVLKVLLTQLLLSLVTKTNIAQKDDIIIVFQFLCPKTIEDNIYKYIPPMSFGFEP